MLNGTLSIMTYNIHKGYGPGRVRYTLLKLKQEITRLNPDVVCLQEVRGYQNHYRDKLVNTDRLPQFEFIAESTWPYYTYGKNSGYSNDNHHGNAILSKYPIVVTENITWPSHPRASRGLLHSVLSVGNENSHIHLICTHLGLAKKNRNHQINSLSERIAEMVPQNHALVIAGDFNDWRQQDTEAIEKELGIYEAFKVRSGEYARTYPAVRPIWCNDRIYFRGLNLVDVVCYTEKPWRGLSDHLPLLARFKLNTHQ